MTFLAFIGELILFVLLALLVPRTSFVVLLGIYIHNYQKIDLFFSGNPTFLGVAITVVLFFGGMLALFLDWYTAHAIKDDLENSP